MISNKTNSSSKTVKRLVVATTTPSLSSNEDEESYLNLSEDSKASSLKWYKLDHNLNELKPFPLSDEYSYYDAEKDPDESSIEIKATASTKLSGSHVPAVNEVQLHFKSKESKDFIYASGVYLCKSDYKAPSLNSTFNNQYIQKISINGTC